MLVRKDPFHNLLEQPNHFQKINATIFSKILKLINSDIKIKKAEN